MSRAYRIKVRESLRRVLRAHDRVSTQLELLEVLPPEQMAQLLIEELKARGFEEKGGALVRKQKGVTVRVDPAAGTVTVEAEASQEAALEGEKAGRAYDDIGPHAQQVIDLGEHDLVDEQQGVVEREEDETEAAPEEQARPRAASA